MWKYMIEYRNCYNFHYSDIMMGAIASQITKTKPFVQTQINENMKALRHWPLWGEFTGDR